MLLRHKFRIFLSLWNCNPNLHIGPHKSLMPVYKCHKHAVKQVCDTLGDWEAGARMHTAPPVPVSAPGKAGVQRSAQGLAEVRGRQGRAGPWTDWPGRGQSS